MISRLYIDPAVENHPMVESIRSSLGSCVLPEVCKEEEAGRRLAESADPIAAGKRCLMLTQNKGRFIKSCPGTKSYICCGYNILHTATFCTMDCAYCILQAYFDTPMLRFFVNHEQLFAELDEIMGMDVPPFHRIGTGEFTDSLIWEPWTGLCGELVARFANQDKIALELKTKTSSVGFLKGIDHNKKTILSWSLNPSAVLAMGERGTAPTSNRLKAAAACEQWGYPLAFHFDPLILYDGWEKDYRFLIRELFETVRADSVVWISLGSLRFMPSLKPIIQKRFPEFKAIYGEFISGQDGKMRYFKPLRIDLYSKIVTWIRELAPEVRIYLCMEDEQTWEKSLGIVPDSSQGLAKILDNSAAKHCGLGIT